MDILAIQAAMTSLKAATDISKAIIETKSIAEVQRKIIELQSALLEAQTSAISATTVQFELHDKIRILEEQLKATHDWGCQETRYSLVCPWRGPAQVYALKKSASEGEEPHFLCSNCFHSKKRVIVNPAYRNGWVSLVCPSCKSSVEPGFRGIDAPKYAEEFETTEEG